jgi:(R,R)-butanediol dehydrogenase/meso-butanediol dehydrogenase/diacetyl reductase
MSETMRAAVWHGKKDVRVETVPVPPFPPAGWVKVKVAWCGICGSDLHEYAAGPIFIPADAPHPLTGKQGSLILGHEFTGTVVEVGEGVTNVRVGDIVAPDACQHCGECVTCRQGRYNVCEKLAFTGLHNDGAFAPFVNVPAELCYVLPPDVSLEAGAVIEPLATGFKAVREAGTILGETVAIIGAGTIGLGTLMAARAAGAGRIIVIEMSAARTAKAKECGADVVLDPREVNVVETVKAMTGGSGADVAFECVGHKDTGPLAVELIRNAGRAIIVGIFEEPSSFNFFSLSGTDKRLIGTLAYTLSDFQGVAALLANGRLKAEPLITGRIGLEEIVEKGFLELLNNKDAHIKILVQPQ